MSKAGSEPRAAGRFVSIDAARGLTMLVMIFVNDLGEVPNTIVPAWMKHSRLVSGITFVDLVFPAFLFIVGMSIPFALSARLNKGEPPWKTVLHIVSRTLALLAIGILMVNGTPDSAKMGWSGSCWEVLMFLSSMLAFCVIVPSREASEARRKGFRAVSLALRGIGFAGLIILAFAFRNQNGRPMITLWPFYMHHIWYGILGYIGWAYLMSAMAFLAFRTNLTALLGSAVLMMCLYPASKLGLFDKWWVAQHVNIGIALGSRAAIAALGVLLGVKLLSASAGETWPRIRFALYFTAGCTAAAWLLGGLYGVSKETATPAWALWGCVATTALWLVFYFISDVRPVKAVAKPFALAGQNVLLPYLISEMLPSLWETTGLGSWYAGLAQPNLTHAILRSFLCAVVVLSVTMGLNRIGLRLKL